MNGKFTAPSIVRLRRLLHQQGFRLRPWCTQEEILSAFYSQLADAAHRDDFWRELGALAKELALDLEQPMQGNPYGVNVTNNTARLLDEIRGALAAARDAQRGYRTLHRRMPTNALTLLALSLVAVGCGGAVASDQDRSPAAGGYSSGDTTYTSDCGTGHGTNGTGEGGSIGTGGARRTPFQGKSLEIDDAPLAAGGAAARLDAGIAGFYADAPCSEPSDPAPSVEQIMDACGVSAPVKQAYLDELNASEASWPAGFAAYFACENCGRLVELIEHALKRLRFHSQEIRRGSAHRSSRTSAYDLRSSTTSDTAT